MQTEIDELKALIAKVEAGQWVGTTLHELASAAKALVAKVEFEDRAIPPAAAEVKDDS